MICPHCQDQHTDRTNTPRACPECWAELRDGTIPPPEIITHREHGGSYGPTDDTSPAWENAVGRMEDGQ